MAARCRRGRSARTAERRSGHTRVSRRRRERPLGGTGRREDGKLGEEEDNTSSTTSSVHAGPVGVVRRELAADADARPRLVNVEHARDRVERRGARRVLVSSKPSRLSGCFGCLSSSSGRPSSSVSGAASWFGFDAALRMYQVGHREVTDGLPDAAQQRQRRLRTSELGLLIRGISAGWRLDAANGRCRPSSGRLTQGFEWRVMPALGARRAWGGRRS